MSNNIIHSFKYSKDKGLVGQNKFKERYPRAKESSDNKCDFILRGKTVELKTDFYDSGVYKNFYIEYLSNDIKKSKGSIFKAAADKIDYFVYFFITNGEFYWFKVKDLHNYLKTRITKCKRYKKKVILNKYYKSIGYLIKIEELKKFVIKVDRFNV